MCYESQHKGSRDEQHTSLVRGVKIDGVLQDHFCVIVVKRTNKISLNAESLPYKLLAEYSVVRGADNEGSIFKPKEDQQLYSGVFVDERTS